MDDSIINIRFGSYHLQVYKWRVTFEINNYAVFEKKRLGYYSDGIICVYKFFSYSKGD